MTNEEIRNTILTICRDSEIEDLDPDAFNVFPSICGQIGTFFIDDACLYHGELSGSPKYWPIGRCKDIIRILYRLYEDDRLIDFCFEFSDMLFVLTHNEYNSCELELIENDSHITDEAEILAILKGKIINSGH